MQQINPVSAAPEEEVARVMQICNACRYCESYCAVFPAMTRRLTFDAATVHYLANLCHSCGACLHACQYAPPHEFAVNVPKAMAKVRRETYEKYAWPGGLGRLYKRNGLVLVTATMMGIALFLAMIGVGPTRLFRAVPDGDFYRIFSHNSLVATFGVAFGWAVLALGVGVSRFWREQTPGRIEATSFTEAVGHVLTLTYLDGGHGDGCNESSDRFTQWRRRFHHATFYGFMFCFAATAVATVYHYVFGWHAPYALMSLPVVLGTIGGVGLVVGPIGLLWLNVRRHPDHGDRTQQPMDRAFIGLLLLTGASGLALLACRESLAMPILLALHLGSVIAFFLTMPYGKFAHAMYRCAALLKWAVERRRTSTLKLGTE